ncbi:MAG: 50S ribosomal protein L21 [Candidatus Moranbacteria bacterium]|nr:50S ribosomal protein L21 [Candidatus Moranbacteria bacterium]
MLAIIRTGGKQYLVSEGEKVKIEKIDGEMGSTLSFEVLYVGDDKDAQVGTPILEGAKVEGKILAQNRRDKVWGIKYKAKKRYKVKFGHRQPYTEVEIVKVSAK